MFQAMAEISVYMLWDGLLLLTGAAVAATIIDVATAFLYFPEPIPDDSRR